MGLAYAATLPAQAGNSLYFLDRDMRKHLLGLMLIAGLAGCTSESDPTAPLASVDDALQGASSAVPTQASLAAARGSLKSFASLPDRGELVAYGDGVRKVRRSGAYTYHPVAISEAHALNAIGGEIAVNTPEGKALHLQYERHEEQPDGNWTWIGRGEDGSSAVLTFGDRAVFGMVSNGDDYYRVRTDRTGAWVVATDRSLVAANGGQRQAGPDALLPGESGLLTSAGANSLAKAASLSKATAAESAVVVDVLIGYSSGLVSAYGSAAAAATFVTNLAALTNTAYANSGVNMRVRVVHTLQVNYGDDSDNQDALQQMTGYDANSQQPITPNAAFSALRAARDEYGADLVAFVRRYREPEQDGCGIAWLLGMNQSGITAADDAEFGYAVVSDGEDTDESDGNTYFCSDFSLAHELGHLMGQAHNEEDANAGGAHVDSYGYREASASGFFTIMAYPASDSQAEIPYFANPLVNFATGRPTGVANQSDNVRSMNITMPIISGFRDTVVPLATAVRNDFNGDGVSDILWRNTSTGANQFWRSGNSATAATLTTVAKMSWQVVGVGDFNGDAVADILWRDMATGRNQIWRSGSNSTQTAVTTVANMNWQVAGVGDFNGDGVDDILWRDASTGRNQIWRSGSSSTQTAITTVGNRNWKVVGIGDFDGDDVDDILWRDASTGRNQIWRSGDSSTQTAVSTVGNPAWNVIGIGDFDGDGNADILWRNVSTGANQIWRSGNSATQTAVATVGNPAWKVVGIGDFNGDEEDDILWRNTSTGANQIWRSADNETQQSVSRVGNMAWQVVGF